MLNVAIVLSETAARYPERIAVIHDERKINYAQLEESTNRLASALTKLGVHQGQKVLIMLPNIPEFVTAYHGVLKMGGLVVAVNILYKARELEYLLTDSEAVAIIACTECLQDALEAYRNTPTCQHLILVDFTSPAPKLDDKGYHHFNDLIKSGSPEFEIVATNPDDTGCLGYT